MRIKMTVWMFCIGLCAEDDIIVKSPPCLPLWAGGDTDILRSQEKNNTQGSSVHFRNRDGEDQNPGEEAGQGVHDHQRRIPQQQPHVGGETMLHNKNTIQKILGAHVLFSLMFYVWKIYPVGSARRSIWRPWDWHLCGWRQQNWWVILCSLYVTLTVGCLLTTCPQCISNLDKHNQRRVMHPSQSNL